MYAAGPSSRMTVCIRVPPEPRAASSSLCPAYLTGELIQVVAFSQALHRTDPLVSPQVALRSFEHVLRVSGCLVRDGFNRPEGKESAVRASHNAQIVQVLVSGSLTDQSAKCYDWRDLNRMS